MSVCFNHDQGLHTQDCKSVLLWCKPCTLYVTIMNTAVEKVLLCQRPDQQAEALHAYILLVAFLQQLTSCCCVGA